MKKAILYIHGKGGNIYEAEHYTEIFEDSTVIGLDYKGSTPWETKDELLSAYDDISSKYDSISVIANSIGAYFTMNALQNKKIERAYFISPVIDMENMILSMMYLAKEK